MLSEWSAELTLTEESSRELFKVLNQQDQEFINGLLDGKHGFTLQSSDGRSVELVPAPKWIPCSERLPEEGEFVIARMRLENHNHQWEELSIIKFSSISFDYWQGVYDNPIVAWMPLPEPYKGRSE